MLRAEPGQSLKLHYRALLIRVLKFMIRSRENEYSERRPPCVLGESGRR